MHCRVTVVVLVCLYVTMKAALYLIYMSNARCHRVFLSCGLHWKRFVQQFWHHLLTTATFLAPWRALDEQKRQQWLFFSVQRVCTVSDSSYVTTDLPLIIAQSLHAGVKFLWLCYLWPCKCARIGMATVSLWQLLHYNILKGWSVLWGEK